jgi:hypothetical protein
MASDPVFDEPGHAFGTTICSGPTSEVGRWPSTSAAGSVDDDPSECVDDVLARGAILGRYVILSRIGKGGMGVVYAAYDPDLDRKVALKLLLSHHGGGVDGRLRLLREAQAMAQLTDPNVVAVYDVGAFGDRVWIAMEFIHGQTLSSWLKQRPRSWREVLPVFLRAGDGLAAAHTAGLVHRDFKPDNVMIDETGRVHVMDFGLVRSDRSLTKDLPNPLSDLRGLDALRAMLTHEGAMVGTPQYMAPEQWAGTNTDTRTDQFSFCVALWEALHGGPPFAATTVDELVVAVLEGRLQKPANSRVPRWLNRAMLRGLQVDPGRRFPTTRALLDALGFGGSRGQVWRILVGLCVAATVVAGVLVGQRLEHAQRAAHAVLREKVRGARDHSAAIVSHVLGLRAGMLADYDPLALELRRLVELRVELRAVAQTVGGAHQPEVLALLDERDGAVGRTVEQVERFKTQYSVLRQSSQVFPVLVAELMVAAPELDDRLDTLLRELLRFNNMADDEAFEQIRAAMRDLVAASSSEVAHAQLELLRRHTELILEHRPAVDRLVREVAQLQADPSYEALADAIVASDAATIGPDDALRWMLIVAGLGGLGGLGSIAAWLLLRARRRFDGAAPLR